MPRVSFTLEGRYDYDPKIFPLFRFVIRLLTAFNRIADSAYFAVTNNHRLEGKKSQCPFHIGFRDI